MLRPTWLHIPGCLALGEWSHHHDYLGCEDLFCTVLLCILATFFLISSASVRSVPFPSFIEPIFAWIVPLVSWAPKNWCFWTVVLEKTLESPLDCKEIQTVHPRGDQSCVFIGRTDVEAETSILWPPDAKSWLIGKDPDAGRGWEPGTTEDEMVGWHHRLNGYGFR